MARRSTAEFTRWFNPLLDALRELGDSGKPREVSDKIAQTLNLPNELLQETIKSGQGKFYNQVAWARQYLVWEGMLDATKHGTWRLTDKGRNTGHLSDDEITGIVTKWRKVHVKSKKASYKKAETEQEEEPVESVTIQSDTGLLEVLRHLSATGFEKVCRELLRESGFENVEVTGGSADGGIDGYGTLELNPFISVKVLFQCKKYGASTLVSRTAVGDFRNAMMGRAEKGMIITTSTFTKPAIDEANRDGVPPIELIDGDKLVKMFERVELGVVPKTVYEVDLAYFDNFK